MTLDEFRIFTKYLPGGTRIVLGKDHLGKETIPFTRIGSDVVKGEVILWRKGWSEGKYAEETT